MKPCPNPSCRESDPLVHLKKDRTVQVRCQTCDTRGPARDDELMAIESWDDMPRLSDDTSPINGLQVYVLCNAIGEPHMVMTKKPAGLQYGPFEVRGPVPVRCLLPSNLGEFDLAIQHAYKNRTVPPLFLREFQDLFEDLNKRTGHIEGAYPEDSVPCEVDVSDELLPEDPEEPWLGAHKQAQEIADIVAEECEGSDAHPQKVGFDTAFKAAVEAWQGIPATSPGGSHREISAALSAVMDCLKILDRRTR